jgi:hypothetical protein
MVTVSDLTIYSSTLRYIFVMHLSNSLQQDIIANDIIISIDLQTYLLWRKSAVLRI